MSYWFRIVGRLEACSFLLLLLIAMPAKYYMGMPIFVRVVGPLHGLLFLGYCGLAFSLALSENWSLRKHLLAYAAAILPCGTFWFEKTQNS
jgi:integral membrane protein